MLNVNQTKDKSKDFREYLLHAYSVYLLNSCSPVVVIILKSTKNLDLKRNGFAENNISYQYLTLNFDSTNQRSTSTIKEIMSNSIIALLRKVRCKSTSATTCNLLCQTSIDLYGLLSGNSSHTLPSSRQRRILSTDCN
uniref:Uncharacterized protein n=1 Tax=Glossina pallidipes TaxID=7398 RepID=A0A1B0A1W3_GLOPL